MSKDLVWEFSSQSNREKQGSGVNENNDARYIWPSYVIALFLQD